MSYNDFLIIIESKFATMRRGFWAISKSLVEERQLLHFECSDWTRQRTSSKYLALSIYVELLFAGTFYFYAFGEQDNGNQCFGQVVTSLGQDHVSYRQVTSFTVDGMSNIDISGHISLWYMCGFFLLIAQVCVQLIATILYCRQRVWVETLYLILDGVMLLLLIGWLSLGAYWRFSDWGNLCSVVLLHKQGEGMRIFYLSNALIACLSLCMCCLGCCAGYWSYFASLPNTRY